MVKKWSPRCWGQPNLSLPGVAATIVFSVVVGCFQEPVGQPLVVVHDHGETANSGGTTRQSVVPRLQGEGRSDRARNRPIEVLTDGYVGSESCRECHQENYQSWYGSYHRTMTQKAHPSRAVSDFDDVEIESNKNRYRLLTRGNQLWVETQPIDMEAAPVNPRRVVLTTGSHHFQAYWFQSGESRKLQLFPLIYRIDEARWMPVEAAFLRPPGSVFPTEEGGAWNYVCLRCHATHGRPRIASGEHMDTHVAEFGISCEACHGPGQDHLQTQGLSEHSQMINPEKLSPARSAEVCGQCHSSNEWKDSEDQAHWVQSGYSYRPGGELERERRIIRTPLSQFWSDGMLRVSGREYNGLLNTPCYQHGDPEKAMMTCLSCHEMHQKADDPRPTKVWANDQLKWKMDTNRPGHLANESCTQCHKNYEDPQILAAHTHHAIDSSGSSCYNCHMPHTTWGVLKAMRSHTVDSPSVATTLETGRPNACNLCHLGQTLAWTAEKLQAWYGQEMPAMSEDQRTVADVVLAALTGDAGQRALAAWNMGWGPAREVSGDQWMAPVLATLLEDPYNVVRTTAHRSLKKIAGYQDFVYDFVGLPAQRRAAKERAISIWKRKNRQNHADAHVLIDADGQLDQATFDRLYRQRNDHPMHLSE